MDIWDDTPEGVVHDRRNARHRNPEIEAIRKSNAYKKARNIFRAHACRQHARCYVCNGQIDYRLKYPHPQAWTLEHRIPVNDAVELMMDVNNWDSAHLVCNQRRGARDVQFDLGVPSERW